MEDYTVRTAGFAPVRVIISPGSYRGLSPENLARAEQMVRELQVIRGQRHQIRHKDWGRPIGSTSCVELRPGDKVVYARLKGWRTRHTWGKFVLGREAEPTAHLTINVKLVGGHWRLIRAYPGQHAPAFPGDRNEARGSRKFWATHALVWGAIPVDRDPRETSICPWR